MKKFVISVLLFLSLLAHALADELVDSAGFTKLNEKVFVRSFTLEQPAPTVIFIHGANGVRNKSTYRIWSGILNKWGYNSVVVDLFSARGYDDLSTQGEKVPFGERAKDIIEVVNYIKSKDWHSGNIGLIGFSQGGATIFATSELPTDIIKAGVAFYPACGYVKPVSNPSFDIQMHIGMKDNMSLPHLCNLPFWAEKKKYNVNEYENATHGFDIKAPDRVVMGRFNFSYDEEAHKMSRKRTREFLDMHLK